MTVDVGPREGDIQAVVLKLENGPNVVVRTDAEGQRYFVYSPEADVHDEIAREEVEELIELSKGELDG